MKAIQILSILFAGIYVGFLIVAFHDLNKTVVSPCESLPHRTRKERQDKALCEIGKHVTEN